MSSRPLNAPWNYQADGRACARLGNPVGIKAETSGSRAGIDVSPIDVIGASGGSRRPIPQPEKARATCSSPSAKREAPDRYARPRMVRVARNVLRPVRGPCEHLRTQFHVTMNFVPRARHHPPAWTTSCPSAGRARARHSARGVSSLACRSSRLADMRGAPRSRAFDRAGRRRYRRGPDPQGRHRRYRSRALRACRCAAFSKPGSSTVTSALRGIMSDGATRAEMMALCPVGSR